MKDKHGTVVLRLDLVGAFVWAAILGAVVVLATIGVVCLVAG